MSLAADGFVRFGPDQNLIPWIDAAYAEGLRISQSPEAQATQLRHGETWFVGLDALPNGSDGALAGVPLVGPWSLPDLPLHRAQLSIVYPGYPAQDSDQSDANHAFRKNRFAAHLDGLLPVGPERRRYAQEWHAYILGIPLNQTKAAPTVVWRGSHHIMQDAMRRAIGSADAQSVDVTDAYAQARRAVFDICEPVMLTPEGHGTSFLLHRFALHGTAPWDGEGVAEGRLVAFFRPAYKDSVAWLDLP